MNAPKKNVLSVCGSADCDDGRIAQIFQALASEARLCIVRELRDSEEKCVCDLVGCCGLGWSTVSHHLSILRRAGIVDDEKRGQQVFYRLTLPCVTDFIHCLKGPVCEAAGRTREL